jgi:hypothetical protein
MARGARAMKQVVSVSLGSSQRNHRVETEILGEEFVIERIGTDGDKQRAIELIRELDGKIDAFGMGGIDLYIVAGKRRYVIRDAVPLAEAAEKTPIVDGSGLKNTLERRAIRELVDKHQIELAGKTALMVSAVDRFGMAEALDEAGCELILGDLVFTLGIPIPLRSLRSLDLVARVIAPLAVRLPIEMLYPTGEKQDDVDPKHARYYHQADIVAGDFHFIRRYMPEDMQGKTIITNTTTAADVEELTVRGVEVLVTTTPVLDGRSFGTNVMEGVLVSLADKPFDELTPDDYNELLDRMGFEPQIRELG